MQNFQIVISLLAIVIPLSSSTRGEEAVEASNSCLECGNPLDGQLPQCPVMYRSSAVAAVGGATYCPDCQRGNCCPGNGQGWWLGCVKPWLQETHWGYADLFHERPFGQSVCSQMQSQIRNGLTARLILYRYDFYDGMLDEPHKLNVHGQKRLQTMLPLLEHGCYPLIVQCTPEDPRLAVRRRDAVRQYLAGLTDTVPAEWVIIAEPRDAGLAGGEAIIIDRNLQHQTQEGGGVQFQPGSQIGGVSSATFTGGSSE